MPEVVVGDNLTPDEGQESLTASKEIEIRREGERAGTKKGTKDEDTKAKRAGGKKTKR